VGFKNYIGTFQTSLKIVHAIGKSPKYTKYQEALPEYKQKLILLQISKASQIAFTMRD
jgi:hypothetical protein